MCDKLKALKQAEIKLKNTSYKNWGMEMTSESHSEMSNFKELALFKFFFKDLESTQEIRWEIWVSYTSS